MVAKYASLLCVYVCVSLLRELRRPQFVDTEAYPNDKPHCDICKRKDNISRGFDFFLHIFLISRFLQFVKQQKQQPRVFLTEIRHKI